MKRSGTGKAKHEMPPKQLDAGPTPRFLNIGRTAIGSAQASTDRRMVLADTALAAKTPYVSTRKLRHCWNTMVKPAPINPSFYC